MPLVNSRSNEAFKKNIKEFFERHKFKPGMTKKEKIKQAVAVAFAVKRRAGKKRR